MREVEARLRLSAVDRTAKAFDAVQRRIRAVEKQTTAFNRVQTAMNRSLAGNAALMSRYLAPAAVAYGGGRLLTQFAQQERQLTRTGLVLNATRQQMAELRGEANRTAQRYALSSDAVMETVAAYAAAGAELADIRGDLDLLAKAQQALGANGADIVNTWDAARKSLKLTSEQAEKLFELVGAGGAAGKFEGNDMAQYLPSLLPVAARQGMTGLEAVADVVAGLEAMADRVGSSGEAATAMSDFLEKISSPAVERAFAEMGVDLPKGLKQARKEGKDLYETMRDLINTATKGDATKLSHLFGDKEARRFADMLINAYDLLLDKQNKVRSNAPGLLDRNTTEILADAEARIDRMTEKLKQLGTRVGSGIAEVSNPLLDWVGDKLEYRDAMIAGGKKRGLSEWETAKIMLYGSDHDRGLLAFDGGARSSPYSDKGHMAESPELPSVRRDPRQFMEPPLPRGRGKPERRRFQNGTFEVTPEIEKPPLGDFDVIFPIRTGVMPRINLDEIKSEVKAKDLVDARGHVAGVAGAIGEGVIDTLSDIWKLSKQIGSDLMEPIGRYPDESPYPTGKGDRLVTVNPDRFGGAAGPTIEGMDALRQALEGGAETAKGSLVEGGDAAAEQIRQSAQALIDAAHAIASVLSGAGTEFGQRAASALRSGAAGITVGVRSGPSITGSNVGVSMPHAGVPGGSP